MDVNKVRYFLAVIDHGTMREAAKSLSITQPTLSQALQKLEKEVGTHLFIRNGRRPLVLTSAGERFIEPARDVLRAVERARTSVQDRRFGLEQERGRRKANG